MTDAAGQKLLAQTKVAMEPGSKILVDNILMPTRGASWVTVQMDLLVMTSWGGIERTEKQWNALFSSAGLIMTNKYIHNPIQGQAQLEVEIA